MSRKGGYQIINLTGVEVINPGIENKVKSPVSLEELKRMYENKKMPVISGFKYGDNVNADQIGSFDDFSAYTQAGAIQTINYIFDFVKENGITYVYIEEK